MLPGTWGFAAIAPPLTGATEAAPGFVAEGLPGRIAVVLPLGPPLGANSGPTSSTSIGCSCTRSCNWRCHAHDPTPSTPA